MVELSAALIFIVKFLGGALLTAATFVAGVAARWLLKKIKLDDIIKDDIVRKYLKEAIENAVAYAVDVVLDEIEEAELDFDMKNSILNEAANYVLSKVPDALENFGITEDSLKELLRAELSKYFNNVELTEGL